MKEERVRCFVALDLPREVMNHLKEIQGIIKKQHLFVGKFTEVENLHLTLKFLGSLEEEEVEQVKEKLRQVKFNEFEVELGEVGAFSKKFIKIIWVKLKHADRLQKQIDLALKDMFQTEARFMSHITIARVKEIPNKKLLLEYLKNIKVKNLRFKADKFFMKKSDLQSDGPVYEDLEVFKLR